MTSKDSSRTIDLEIEVPGTPEDVWDAIATGPGVSSWMHPTEIEPREGGRYAFDMGGGMNDSGAVFAWSPPQRFVTEGVEWQPQQEARAARLATEWLVEARDGGSCVVRMVMSGFGDGAAWDNEIEGMADGMRSSLDTLRVYLTYFPGKRGKWLRAFGHIPGPSDSAWDRFLTAVGVSGPGRRLERSTAATHPMLSGIVERVETGAGLRQVLIRTEDPAPGLAYLLMYGADNYASVQVCVYGAEAAQLVGRDEPAWQAWLETELPAFVGEGAEPW